MRSQTPWIVLVLVLAGLLLWRESHGGMLRRVDREFAAWLAREVSPPGAPAGITLVGVGPDTVGASPGPGATPFGEPMDYALFLKAVLPREPAVAVIEPVLAWKNPSPAYLRALEDYGRRTPKLILGTELGRTTDPDEENPRLPILGKVQGDVSGVPEFSAVTVRPSGELREIGSAGVLNLPDPDAAASGWLPMVVRYRGDLVPTLPLLAVIQWARSTPDDVTVAAGREIRIGTHLRIPIDRTGSALIAPGAITAVRRVEYPDLMVDAETAAGQNAAPGDVVMLGRVDGPGDAGAPGGDHRTYPAETFARAIAALQTGCLVREIAPPWLPLPSLALALAGGILFLMPRFSACPATAGLTAAYVMIARGIVSAHGLALPAAAPAGLLLLLLGVRLALPPRRTPAPVPLP